MPAKCSQEFIDSECDNAYAIDGEYWVEGNMCLSICWCYHFDVPEDGCTFSCGCCANVGCSCPVDDDLEKEK